MKAALILAAGAICAFGLPLVFSADAGTPAFGDSLSVSDDPKASETAAKKDTTALSAEVVDGILKLRDEGPKAFPEIYGDIASGVPGDVDVLVVYLTELNSDVEKQVIDLAGVSAEKVAFKKAAMTRLQAEALDEQFNADAQELIAEGFPLQSWGIGDGVTYHVEVEASASRGEAAVSSLQVGLSEKYGPDIVVDSAPGDPRLLSSRANDNVQWYGGDFLNANRGTATQRTFASCTSGFPLTWPATGNKYILTAGHCYVTGEQVYNGIGNVAGGWSTNLVGGVTNRSWNIGYPDAELIAADGSRAMWTGSSAAPTGTVTINTLVNPWRGMPLCVDGAYEGEFCGMTVGDPDHTVQAGGNSIAHQATLTSSNTQAVGDGDSGGPVYATIQGTTYGVGIISSTPDGFYPCTNWSVQIGGRVCGPTVYIQNIGPVLSMWNLVLDP